MKYNYFDGRADELCFNPCEGCEDYQNSVCISNGGCASVEIHSEYQYMSNFDLRNCPFCGCKIKRVEEHAFAGKIIYRIRCNSVTCSICPKTIWLDDKEEAINQWNTRYNA